MRKGFFLTESEKNRISNLYGGTKMFLLEAIDPPASVEEIKSFQKWLDDNYGEWAYSQRNGINYKVSEKKWGYGSFGSQTKAKWEGPEGEKYRKEKGVSTGTASDDGWFIWDEINKKHTGPFTKEQIIQKATEKPEIKVSNKTVTANQYRQAKNIADLGLPMSPETQSFTSKTGSDISTYGNFEGTKINRRETQIDRYYKNKGENKEPLDNMLYKQKSVDGFQDWAKRTMNGIEFNTSPKFMKLEGNKLTTTEGGIERTYYYDDKTQEWRHPMMDNNIRIIEDPGPSPKN